MYDPQQLYVDPVLTNFSVGYKDQTLYGERIMPVTPVRTKSGKYRVFDRSNWLVHQSRREPGTVANEIRGAKWSQDTFETQEHSLQAPVLDEERQQLNSLGGLSDPAFGGGLNIDPELDATSLVTSSLLLEHEQKVSTLVRDPANYPSTNKTALVGAAEWDDYTGGEASTSNPVNDIMVGMRVIKNLTGRDANVLAIPSQGVSFIENHPRVVARFKTFTLTDPGAFQQLTGFQGEIITTDSGYNAADNIDAAENFQWFWGKDVWLGIVDPTPGQKTKTFGKTFSEIYPDGSIRPVDRWREQDRKADIIRASYAYDLKIVSSVAGYLIQTAFSSGAW